MAFDPDLKPVYLQVVDCDPVLKDWQPYGRWELPQKLPPEVFWKVAAVNVDRMTAHMRAMEVPAERYRWEIQVSLLTYGELYDGFPS